MACSAAAPAQANGMTDLNNAMADLEDLLDGKDIGITPERLGTRIHGAVAGTWDRMATAWQRITPRQPDQNPRQGIRVLDEEGQRKGQTFLGKQGTHVFGIGEIESRPYVRWEGDTPVVERGRGPRIEVWIEKEIGAGVMRVDRVVIDHEAKTITVSDLTALDPNDRDIASDPALKKHAVEHERAKSTRAELIEREMKAAGLTGYTVHADTEPGQYYKTALKSIRRTEEAELERNRKQLGKMPDLDDAGAGGRAAKATVLSIALMAALPLLTPGPAEAADQAQTQAEQAFHTMVRSYAVGDIQEGDEARRILDDDYQLKTALASSFFPALEPQTAVGAYLRFLQPAVDELRENAQPIAEARQAYRKALADIAADLREPEERLRARAARVREEVRLLYVRLGERIRYWSDRLRSLAGRPETRFWKAAQARELKAFLATVPVRIDLKLAADQDWAMKEFAVREPRQVRELMQDVGADLALGYFAYWNDFLGPAVLWLQDGERAGQREGKAPLHPRYEAEARALQAGSAAPTAWQELRERFAEKEREIDARYRRPLEELYTEWANETAGLADRIKQLTPSAAARIDAIARLDRPDSAVCQLERRLYADFDVLTYANVPDVWRHYTADVRALSVSARPFLETAFGRIVEEEGAVVLLGLWVKVQRPLEVLDHGLLRSGETITLWAEVAQTPYPREHDTHVGPPPSGGIRSKGIVWSLDGVESGQTGHVFRGGLPAGPTTTFPFTRTLRLTRPGAKSLVKRIIIQPSGGPSSDEGQASAEGGTLDDLIAPAAPVEDDE
jgi:hypothetical protein